MTRRKLKLNEMKEGTYLKHNSMIHLLGHIEKLDNEQYIIHAQYAIKNIEGAKLHINYIQEEKFAKSLSDFERYAWTPTEEEIAKLNDAIKAKNENIGIKTEQDPLSILLENNSVLIQSNKELINQNITLANENKKLRESFEKLMKELK